MPLVLHPDGKEKEPLTKNFTGLNNCQGNCREWTMASHEIPSCFWDVLAVSKMQGSSDRQARTPFFYFAEGGLLKTILL